MDIDQSIDLIQYIDLAENPMLNILATDSRILILHQEVKYFIAKVCSAQKCFFLTGEPGIGK